MQKTILKLLAIGLLFVGGTRLEAQSQTLGLETDQRCELIEIGPIDGLTSTWYAAPRASAIPIGSTIRLRVRSRHDQQVVWQGAREIERRNGWSTAELEAATPGPRRVTVELRDPGAEMHTDSTILTVLETRIQDIAISPIRIEAESTLLDVEDNAATMAQFFRDASIAEVRQGADGVFTTSINRWMRLKVDVEPAAFGPLVEWRLDDEAQAHLGTAIRMRVFPARRFRIAAGPDGASSADLETYRVRITSHRDGDEIAEWQPVTFRAVTEPPGFEQEISWLASTKYGACDPLRGQGPEFTVRFRQTLGEQGRWLGVRADDARFEKDAKVPGQPGRQDEVSVRTEPNLGRPSRMVEDPGEGPWLMTEANRFVKIQKQAFFRGNAATVNGIQMASSFVAETATRVAIYFSAEAFVAEYPLPVEQRADLEPDQKGRPKAPFVDGNKRLFVRALVDGEPVDPNDVVLTVGAKPGVRSFLFTTEVQSGIHTVEIEWLVDPPGAGSERVVGYMRDASLLIRQGRIDGENGSLVVQSAPSGPSVTTDSRVWTPLPGMSAQVDVPAGSALVASLSAEAQAEEPTRFALRAVVNGEPITPKDVIFADGDKYRSRTATFVAHGLDAGLHDVRFEWLSDGAGQIRAGDRSLSLAAFPSSSTFPNRPAVAAGGVQDSTDFSRLQPIPDLETTVWIPEEGHGEVAVIFSAEAHVTEGGELAVSLRVDGETIENSRVILTQDDEDPDVRSWVFDAKGLTPGFHHIALDWASLSSGAPARATLGDRAMAVIAEVGAIPDLAEQGGLGVGLDIFQVDRGPDHITGLEPVIGSRDVLVVLWDADRPGQPDQSFPEYAPGQLRQALFEDSHSMKAYFELTSGDRFTVRNAGVLGWFDAERDEATNYWNHPGTCTSDGYKSGALQRRSEAVKAAAASGFPFGDHDDNNDGRISGTELAIVIIYPQSSFFGQARRTVLESEGACNGGQDEALVADGVVIEEAVDCFGCSTTLTMVVAHELAHHLLGLDDLYSNVPNPATQAAWKGLMAITSADNNVIVNPAYRLALGWATPRIIEEGGVYTSLDTKLSDQVFVLPRYDHLGMEEYFLIENRQQDVPEGWEGQLGGSDLVEKGLAVWHVISEAADRIRPPIGVNQDLWVNDVTATPGRHGIRLLRPWTEIDGDSSNAIFDPRIALWSSNHYDLLSAPCPEPPPPGINPALNTLTWADCTKSGYDLLFLSPPPVAPGAVDPLSTAMRFEVLIDP